MENQLTTDPTQKTAEQIHHEMLETRESLTEKVAALEHQVVGTVKEAADTFTETVDAVKGFVESAPETVSHTVKEAAEAVSETVKKTFDFTGQVQARPWTALGVSTGLGFLTGLLVFRERETRPSSAPAPRSTLLPPAPHEPGLIDDLFGLLARKAREVAETAIDVATASVHKKVQELVPHFMDRATEHLTSGEFASRE